MKKLIVGLIAIGAILALRTAAGRIGQKMREHCKEMAEQFGPGQTAEMQEHSEHEAPRPAGHEEAVSTA
jgi:hypothetical protein